MTIGRRRGFFLYVGMSAAWEDEVSKQSDKLADLFFDRLPYSEQMMQARVQVRARLAEMSEKLPFSMLAENYHSIEKLALLAGYTSEDVAEWESETGILGIKTTTRRFRCNRWLSYLIGVLCAAIFAALLFTIFHALSADRRFFVTLTLLLIGIVAAIFALMLFRRTIGETADAKYDADAYMFLRAASDKYVKRLLNSVALFVAAVFVFEMTELNLYIFGNSRASEVLESILSNRLLVAIPIFFLIKNILILRTIRVWIALPDKGKMCSHLFVVSVFAAFYWTICMIAMIVFRTDIAYPAKYVLFASVVFFLSILIYNLILRKKLCFRNLVLNKVRLSVVIVLVLLASAFFGMNRDTWYTQPYINAVPVVGHRDLSVAYNEETGVYTLIAAHDDFKILHLTDIHLGGSLFSYKKDILAFEACYAEIKYTRPDLVIVTGDLCFPMGIMSMSFNNSAPVHQFSAFMRNVGIPWAFTFGNHDTESLASMKKEDLVEVYKSLSFKTSGSLLFPYVQPRITGRNNQLIEVRNADGSLNTALFLIDSNAYTGEGFNAYDYIHDDQVDWYVGEVRRLQEEEGGQISSLAFFHIPLLQYRTAYELYLAGSEEVTYHFGENRESFMHMFSCSTYDSAIFDKMVELGSTTGAFCGHDHYNNASITYRGIRLTYGMSIDYLAMPGIAKEEKQRGGELITLHADSSWDVEQIPLTSIL